VYKFILLWFIWIWGWIWDNRFKCKKRLWWFRKKKYNKSWKDLGRQFTKL